MASTCEKIREKQCILSYVKGSCAIFNFCSFALFFNFFFLLFINVQHIFQMHVLVYR